MRRTLACCQPVPEGRRGFTLLELLIVLALMALLTALVAPNLRSWLQRSEERAWTERAQDVLSNLPIEARRAERASRWTASELTGAMNLPGLGLELVPNAPLQYDDRGLASGGEVALWHQGRALASWRVVPNLGHVEQLQGNAIAGR